ncbi:DUF3014 domain-containing protein [Shewanella sp. AS1]|uniref:DUF3014 domain-containing protein n=1 Tax=Shewanella sp. AS1 TaxID=2907626 RepID=UPI001F2C1C50|nr:DUF3014 domain-containing protein [Shewanella sp. AS1]MCE9680341.1 DUF3014 domain-containing protein [Shewanella sp. AS1]
MQVNQEDRIAPQEKRGGASGLTIAIVVILLMVAGGIYYFLNSKDEAPQTELQTPVTLPTEIPEEPLVTDAQVPEPEVALVAEPELITPTVEPQVEATPLPALAESDSYVTEQALEVADGMKIDPILVEKDIVRHFVVFVDNLAQGELARKVSPLKAPNGSFSVSDVTDKTYLNPDSYHRYDLYADFAAGLNDQELMATYKKLSPLLNEAFEELGYNNQNFDDRMLKAIDVMLAAPIIEHPIEVTSVSVNYQFVDPELEALPNAQKLMIRMGPQNSKKVKAALRKLKLQLQK